MNKRVFLGQLGLIKRHISIWKQFSKFNAICFQKAFYPYTQDIILFCLEKVTVQNNWLIFIFYGIDLILCFSSFSIFFILRLAAGFIITSDVLAWIEKMRHPRPRAAKSWCLKLWYLKKFVFKNICLKLWFSSKTQTHPFPLVVVFSTRVTLFRNFQKFNILISEFFKNLIISLKT